MKHGTLDAYTNHRCRCIECRAACAEYRRERRCLPPQPNRRGRTVRVDGHALRVYALSSASSLGAFALKCGLSRESVYKIVKRGTTTEATLDKISCYLGVHMSALEAA